MKSPLSRFGVCFALALFLPSLYLTSAADQSHLLRHPTYSHGKVAFSYLGDLWIASEDGSGIQRLTDHKARDVYPRFSPDGKWIAFSSDREGNYDAYVIPAAGGKPRQLTFNSANDVVVGWSPTGNRVIFTSTRNNGVFPSVATLFEIPADGGMEQPLPTDWGSWASYSPDGSKLAFSRHPGVWSRKHYRGSYAVDLWLMDVGTKQFARLGDPEYKGNYLWPMYGHSHEIFFVADRLPMEQEKNLKYGSPEVMKSVNNIWKISETGGAPAQVTHHTDGGLFFPSISADGKTIVYEENFGLWKLDTKSGKSSEIKIAISSDNKDSDVELRTIVSEADGFHLSPSGKRAAISTHGEIFTIATDRGESQRVTETPWREQSPRWSPDGKWIAFISDRTGREEVWISDERAQKVRKLSDIDCDKYDVTWGLDSKSLLWVGSDHKLRQVQVESGDTQVLVTSENGRISNPQFSPDGKWISYSKPDALTRSHVYVRQLDGGEEHMIGADDFLLSSGARWMPNGKKLLLLGGVGAPTIATLGRTTSQLYSVALTHLDKNPDDRDVDTEEQAQASDPNRRGAGTGQPAQGKAEVKIEWDGLDRRIKKLTRMAGAVYAFAPSPDSRTIAFVASGGGEDGDSGSGRPALYTIGEDGSRLTQVSQGAPPDPSGDAPTTRASGGGLGEPQWSRDGRIIYYLQGSGIYSIAAPTTPSGDAVAAAPSAPSGGKGGGKRSAGASTAAATESSSTPRRIAFTVRLEVDRVAERKQVFEEAWRVMKNRFYDAKMHGIDWAAARAKYESLLADVADTDELHNVIMQMIGELNASHTGISGGSNPVTERIQTYYPGFDLEPDASGYYKVAHIYKKGPADHDYVKLASGNFILSVNGKDLKTSDNYWKMFNLIPGKKFEFTVNSKPEMDGKWTVSLDPLSASAQAGLDYDLWVDHRREMVDTLSNGEVGYLHIKAMDAPSLQKFQRDLLANQGKRALIIDQRFNGGGGIDQELLAILSQRKYQSTRGRDSLVIPRPIQAFFGPMVVLQNERSASDAEMFPDGFRALGLGKLVGMPTYGAVIGTGAFRLLDGSSIRTPGSAVFTAKGEDMENYGVIPDVQVDNTPADFLTGHDRQIEKAIEVLHAELK